MSALIIVDVQHDFLDGSMALPVFDGKDAQSIISKINTILDTVNFDLVVYTLDYHKDDHISFIENVVKWKPIAINDVKLDPGEENYSERIKAIKNDDVVTFDLPSGPRKVVVWTKHCVENTKGAQLHSSLKQLPESDRCIRIRKAYDSDIDAYSAIWDNERIKCTRLASVMKEKGIKKVLLCGVALDYCVFHTTMDCLREGFDSYLIEDCGMGATLEKTADCRAKIIELGGKIIQSSQVHDVIK